jgi:Arc/MetJ-type ribon-helix-helix transcriptional regulator
MTVHIKPELEAIIDEELKNGNCESAEEYVERAIQMLHEEQLWLLENRHEIAAQIEEGWAQAERGELIDADDARAMLQKHREEWLELTRHLRSN